MQIIYTIWYKNAWSTCKSQKFFVTLHRNFICVRIMKHQELSSRLVSLCFILWGVFVASVYADANTLPRHMVDVTAEGAACRLSTDGNDQINDIINYLNSYLTEQENNPPKNRDIENIQLPELQYLYSRIPLSQISVYFQPLENLCEKISALCQRERDDEPYYYHPDHLGGAAWITDNSGTPVQYLHYAPYGELVANQIPYGYDERFKFTGKERDAETGYDYFGARYYWSALGHFISPDPLSGKTPDISSYAYCGWNPVNRIDPDGRVWESIWDVAWLAWDGASFLYNTIAGNAQEAAMDAASFTADGATLLLPGVPAVVGPARASAKLAPKVAEATPKVAKAMEKVITATKNTYRQVLQKVTGKLGKGYEAHHTLPQKYRNRFEKLGINIDDPEHVVWRKKESHRAGNAEHGDKWDKFFKKNPSPTKEQVIEFRNQTEQQVWGNRGDTPLQ